MRLVDLAYFVPPSLSDEFISCIIYISEFFMTRLFLSPWRTEEDPSTICIWFVFSFEATNRMFSEVYIKICQRAGRSQLG